MDFAYQDLKRAVLLALFGYILFLFGFTVGEFAERQLRAQRLAAVVVRAAREKPDEEPERPASDMP